MKKRKLNSVTVVVPIYFQQTKKKKVLLGLNWYRNAHFVASNNAKRWIAKIIGEQVKDVLPLSGELEVRYVIYLKNNRSDGGNVRSVIEKFGLDALVKAGIIVDDKSDIITQDESIYLFDKKNPRAEITIIKK